jgi:hypothetical protein
MTTNLDSLLPDIFDSLKERGLAIFHCEMRAPEPQGAVYWDVDQHPSHEDFLEAATIAGVKIVTLFSRRFSEDQIEEAKEQLEESDLDARDRRTLELKLRDLRAHEGHVCHIELSFSQGSREYIFDIRADWFEEYGDLMDRIETSFMVPDDDSPLDGGYYSKN